MHIIQICFLELLQQLFSTEFTATFLKAAYLKYVIDFEVTLATFTFLLNINISIVVFHQIKCS